MLYKNLNSNNTSKGHRTNHNKHSRILSNNPLKNSLKHLPHHNNFIKSDFYLKMPLIIRKYQKAKTSLLKICIKPQLQVVVIVVMWSLKVHQKYTMVYMSHRIFKCNNNKIPAVIILRNSSWSINLWRLHLPQISIWSCSSSKQRH